jgi:hypothetical protein
VGKLFLLSEQNAGSSVAELLNLGWTSPGADPNAKDMDGNTPMHLPCNCIYNDPVEEMVKVLKALLERGDDINAANNEGEHPIHVTLREQESDAVKWLLQHHYSNLCDGEDRLPLHAFLTDAQFDGNPAPPLRAPLDEVVLKTNDV